MSRRKVNTVLEGYGRPIFPKGIIDELNEVYEKGGANGFIREEMGKEIEEFEKIGSGKTTNDGYGWFWGLHCKVHCKAGEGKILVLFPWPLDSYSYNKLDRSIAVYQQGEVNTQNIQVLLKRILSILRKQKKL